jgi:hypothetical protein
MLRIACRTSHRIYHGSELGAMIQNVNSVFIQIANYRKISIAFIPAWFYNCGIE